MEEVLALVLHKKLFPPEAVRVMLPPEQILLFPEIDAVMLEVTFTVTLVVLEQFPFVTVTE